MNNDLDYDFCDVDNIYPESPVDILRDFGLKGNVPEFRETIEYLSYGRNGCEEDRQIHDQALETAIDILNNHVTHHSLQFIVVSGTQTGKTNLMTTFTHLFSDYVASKNNFVGKSSKTVAYVFGPPVNDLEDQTIERFEEVGHESAITSDDEKTRYITSMKLGESGSGRDTFVRMIRKDRRDQKSIIFFFDEAHEGSGQKNDNSESVHMGIQNFCKQNNIPLIGYKAPSGRENQEIGIHVTATPAHLISEYRKNKDTFKICVLKPGPGYYGVLDHDSEEDSRIYNVKDFPSLKDLRNNIDNTGSQEFKFFKELLSKFVIHNKNNKDSGHIIFRYSSAGRKTSKSIHPKDMFKKVLGSNLVKNVQFKEFNSAKNNIKKLNSYLSSKPRKGTTNIVFVKQGLGRGITLKKKQHIQLCYESRSSDASTLQSFIGRLTGYNLKFHPMLEIYTDLSVIDSQRRWLELFTSTSCDRELSSLQKNITNLLDDESFCQSGTHASVLNKESYVANMSEDMIFDTIEAAHAYVNSLDYLETGNKLSCSTCKNNNAKDVAYSALTGDQTARFSGSLRLKDLDCGYRVVLLNINDSNKNFVDSWEMLKNLKPELIGKYLVRHAYADSTRKFTKINSS
jgi:hypothetical protein